MPLTIIPADIPGVCLGTEWSVADRTRLVTVLARLLTGRVDHAVTILSGGNTPERQRIRDGLLKELKRRLSLPVSMPPWQRDGLLFELMAWIVAMMTRGAAGIVQRGA